MTPPSRPGAGRWAVLAVAVAAQSAASALVYGLPFAMPVLRHTESLSLTQAGALVVTPVLGLLTTLIAWGAAADRFGERVVMTTGMAGTGLAGLGAALLPGIAPLAACLALSGAFAASINAASGRAVLGWFDASERGLAMGIRQVSQPLGVAIAALALPPLAEHAGYRTALLLPTGLCLLCAVLVRAILVDPPRPTTEDTTRTDSPYRDPRLWRVHLSSALLVAPQFISGTFALTYLVTEQHWDAVTAGALLAAVQAAGALGRIGAGVWSDRAGSRMRPMRTIALLVATALVVWALGDLLAPWLAITGAILVLVISVTDNGLGFTATAELAGPHWAGRALGIQNTAQNLIALAITPIFAATVTAIDWPWALLAAAAFPVAAMATTPVRGERKDTTPAAA